MTNCLRTVDKKVDNQRISLGLTSSFESSLAMRCGCMVLKAEEKFDEENTDRITCCFFFQDEYMRCAKECVASSAFLLCLYANWYGSKWGFVCFMSWWRMIHSKHFNRCQKSRTIIV